jgi:ATP-dependent DNA helicase RecG
MTDEGSDLDNKSIRYALGKHKDADHLACDCVGFANAAGGSILLGIEDGQNGPPAGQLVPEGLADKLNKRIPQITTNVSVTVHLERASNGGEYLRLQVARNEQSIAATSDGRYFLRVADETKRLLPDDLGRLMTERNTLVWEIQPRRKVPADRHDSDKLEVFVAQVKASDRVSAFVKAKSAGELLTHYFFADGPNLTNLGVLWVGRREDRAALLHAPVVQCIRYDDRGQKIWKRTWDLYDLNPYEIIEAVWREVPDWQESYEIPEGIFRKSVPHYDEVVVRELLANALVHRPYTQRGDIFLNLHPDRLEVHNPGLLPIGVTPQNILHTSIKRNPHLAKVFYDLKLMEGEGSGFDRMYEVLLCSGRPAPKVEERDDRVVVTVQKRIVNAAIVDFVAKADQHFMLSQKERITLGLLAQYESLTALQMAKHLDLKATEDLQPWLGRLVQWKVARTKGRTKGMQYSVEPELLRKLNFKGATTLKAIEKHRLRELILRDLEIYKASKIGEIQARIGAEIPRRQIQYQLQLLVGAGEIGKQGEKRHRVYLWTKKGGIG